MLLVDSRVKIPLLQYKKSDTFIGLFCFFFANILALKMCNITVNGSKVFTMTLELKYQGIVKLCLLDRGFRYLDKNVLI